MPSFAPISSLVNRLDTMPIDFTPRSSLTGNVIGSLRGGPTQGGAGAFGAVPTVPDPSQTQGAAIGGNMANLGALYGLTGSLNTEIAGQAALPFQLNLPNYQQNIGQSGKNTASLLQGQIPTDVSNQLAQQAAERGISTGSIGSPNANSALMRALGVTSLGLQQQGEQNLSGEIARTPTGQQFNPASFLTTPEGQQEMQYLANLYAAAPDPGAGQNLNLKNFLSGLGGMGGPGGVRGGGGGNTDPLGFANDNFMSGGAGVGPGQVAGGALGWPGGAQSGQPTGASGAFNMPDLGQGDWTMWGGGLGTGGGGSYTGNILGNGWQGNPGDWVNQLNQDMEMYDPSLEYAGGGVGLGDLQGYGQ